MINLMHKDDVIEMDMTGEITAQDYKNIRPQMEAILAREGKSKFLFDMTGVSHFTAGAIWEDIKADLANIKYIGTTAIVANKKIYEYLTKFVNAVYPEKIKHFEDRLAAEEWVAQN